MELTALVVLLLIVAGAYFFFIHPFVEDVRKRREFENSDLDRYPENGTDFEHWVAAKLRRYGWRANVTRSGGDQGIDVIAEKSDVRLGIQCKRLSKPCGNRAVQEALSGGAFYGLPNVAVVATSGFTKSAKDLAARTNCLLISNYDLPNLDGIFGIGDLCSDVRLVDRDSIILKLTSPCERIFGKCCVVVARKCLPELVEIVPELSEKVISNVDRISGEGELKISKLEIKALLDLVNIVLSSSVELSPDGADFEAAPRDLGGDKREYSDEVGADGIDTKKLKKGVPVPFFSVFPSGDIRELRAYMQELYREYDIPLPNDPSGFLGKPLY